MKSASGVKASLIPMAISCSFSGVVGVDILNLGMTRRTYLLFPGLNSSSRISSRPLHVISSSRLLSPLFGIRMTMDTLVPL